MTCPQMICKQNIAIIIAFVKHPVSMDILQQAQTFFLESKQFWMWHGFVLSGLWVLVSAFGILMKRVNMKIHVLTFIFVNFTTIAFAGAALYRLFDKLPQFLEWSPLKQAHVAAGSLFLVLVICQHIGGATAFFGQKRNPQHSSFGNILVLIGRFIAAAGWVLGGHQQNAIIVAVISLVLLGLSFVVPGKQAASSPSKASASDSQRSKSPKARRQ